MGTTWTLDFFSWLLKDSNEELSAILHLTDIINCIQGVLIFILFVWKPKVKKLIIRRQESTLSWKEHQTSDWLTVCHIFPDMRRRAGSPRCHLVTERYQGLRHHLPQCLSRTRRKTRPSAHRDWWAGLVAKTRFINLIETVPCHFSELLVHSRFSHFNPSRALIKIKQSSAIASRLIRYELNARLIYSRSIQNIPSSSFVVLQFQSLFHLLNLILTH